MSEIHTVPPPRRLGSAGLVCAALRPVLDRVVRHVARNHPDMFARIAPYETSDFVIVPQELPFALHLRPDPEAPLFRAVPRDRLPPHEARIEGRFALLLDLVDGESDGDAAFFARDLEITGNTEAVVSLRNALDDVDGSIAQETADLFGPPGRAILGMLRRRRDRQ
ncbi:MAG: SCP2 sterol-binding domain-containing protein [Paracoccaceae bacterium]